MSQSSSNRAGIKSQDQHITFGPPSDQPFGREIPLTKKATKKEEKCADSGETLHSPSADKYFNMFGAGGGRSKK